MLAVSYNIGQQVSFGILALMMLVGAIRVVTTKNVVHAALWLVIVLAGAAAQYILLAAEFVAVTQVLVYIGAVMVLFLFGTMLTRSQIGHEADTDNKSRISAAVVALIIAGTLGYDAIFGQYSLPFWALSLVLTAAAVGAIVLARRD
jgi:NADH-quinone oxidoreductase subunit J